MPRPTSASECRRWGPGRTEHWRTRWALSRGGAVARLHAEKALLQLRFLVAQVTKCQLCKSTGFETHSRRAFLEDLPVCIQKGFNESIAASSSSPCVLFSRARLARRPALVLGSAWSAAAAGRRVPCGGEGCDGGHDAIRTCSRAQKDEGVPSCGRVPEGVGTQADVRMHRLAWHTWKHSKATRRVRAAATAGSGARHCEARPGPRRWRSRTAVLARWSSRTLPRLGSLHHAPEVQSGVRASFAPLHRSGSMSSGQPATR